MLIDIRRLGLALLILAVLFFPLYAFVLRSPADESAGLANARLIDTPPMDGSFDGMPDRQLKVGLKNGNLAPNFEISTPDGSRVRLSDLRGRPVLINFFALWCGSCLAEMPVVKEVQEERGLDSFTVLAVNTGESRDRAMEFIEFIDAPFTYGLDFDLTVSDAYGVRGLPHTIYIDAGGIVRAIYSGQASKSRLNVYLDAAFKAAEAGPLPVELRTVSTIPRDNLLQIDARSQGRLVLTSRRLRCDAVYCADSVVSALKATPGVTSVSSRTAKDGQPLLEVSFTPAAVNQEEIVNRVVAALNALKDPLYETPLEIRFTTS